jgi:chaperonin GroES
MKLTPLYDRVVIKPAPPEEVTKGGIIIPDTAKEKPQQVRWLPLGRGSSPRTGSSSPCRSRVGDQVLFGKYAGTEVTIDGEEYLIMRESDIYAIINTNGQS